MLPWQILIVNRDMLESSARSWSLTGVSIPNVAFLQMVFLSQVLNSRTPPFFVLPSHLGFGEHCPILSFYPRNTFSHFFVYLYIWSNSCDVRCQVSFSANDSNKDGFSIGIFSKTSKLTVVNYDSIASNKCPWFSLMIVVCEPKIFKIPAWRHK